MSSFHDVSNGGENSFYVILTVFLMLVMTFPLCASITSEGRKHFFVVLKTDLSKRKSKTRYLQMDKK